MSPFPPCHAIDGEAVDPEEGDDAEESDAEDNADDDASTDIGILACVVRELPLETEKGSLDISHD